MTPTPIDSPFLYAIIALGSMGWDAVLWLIIRVILP